MRYLLVLFLLCCMISCGTQSTIPTKPIRENGIYTAESMARFVVPNETKALVEHFQLEHELDWDKPVDTINSILRWFNRYFRYISDGDQDRWQTPITTIIRLGGDCEDLSILIVSFLRQAGFDGPLQMILGRSLNGGMHVWVQLDLPGYELAFIDHTPYRLYLQSYQSFRTQPLSRGSVICPVPID